jgi:signal transduction histidine kinase/FixJ family two-component response regulator
VAASLLQQAGIPSRTATSFDQFVQSLSSELLFAVVTEEPLRHEDVKSLHAWTTTQPAWSDLPFVVLAHRDAGPEQNPAAARLVRLLGNVSFLERPFHPTTFVSVVQTARAGRLRQYQARASIEALNESELRLKTALVAGRLGSWELDISSWTLTASDVCKTVFGRQPNDPFCYDDLMAAIYPEDRKQVQEAVARTLDMGADYDIEYRTIWPDSSLHWAEIRGRIVRDRRGRALRLIGVASDITDRKHAETALKSMNDALEQRVEERTRELREAHERLLAEVGQREKAEQRLRQSQKLEALGQLTGGVAHDFNNLLMAVLGNLELAEKRVADDPKTARLIGGAIEGARRGASLTQRLLAFARQQALEVKPTDLQTLITGMLDLLTRSVGSTITVVTDFPETVPPVLADTNQVELALLNLAVNARDAMPDGGRITISLHAVDEAQPSEAIERGRYVCLSVTDTGTGMDEVTLARAIDPFFSTKELGKGTGLGLSMIHGLAEQLGGALKLRSKPGAGTSAEIWLPATELREEVSAPKPEPASSPSRPLVILVVDDDVLIAMNTVDMLEDLGHTVIETNAPADALAVIEAGTPLDMMITDFSMPRMNGAELADAVHALRPALPILVATGYADLPPGKGMELPRLSKPYSQQQLAAQIALLAAS